MNIRLKLTLQFSTIVLSIVIVFSVLIYYFSSSYRENDFYERLENRAITTARLLLNVSEVDDKLLLIIDNNTLSLFDEKIEIYNDSLQLIYSNKDYKKGSFPNNLLLRIKSEKRVQTSNNERDVFGLTYRQNNQSIIIIASAFDKYGKSKLNNLKIVLISGLLISIIFVFVSGYFYAGRAMSPISKIIRQVENITASNLNLRLESGNEKDEISRLAQTFNQMLIRLETSFKLQQNFVSSASHELRTPFTIILGEIELTLMKEREKDYYKKVLLDIYTTTKELSNLTNDLLSLAQASKDILHVKLEPIRIDELLFQIQNDLTKQKKDLHIEFKNIKLTKSEKDLIIMGNRQLIKTAFANIINNACKYSNNKTVYIDLKVVANRIRIRFIDHGLGIPKEDISKIFEPFYRSDNAKTNPGNGLGLPLTKIIINTHKGKILVESTVGEGSIFTVLLPNLNSN